MPRLSSLFIFPACSFSSWRGGPSECYYRTSPSLTRQAMLNAKDQHSTSSNVSDQPIWFLGDSAPGSSSYQYPSPFVRVLPDCADGKNCSKEGHDHEQWNAIEKFQHGSAGS